MHVKCLCFTVLNSLHILERTPFCNAASESLDVAIGERFWPCVFSVNTGIFFISIHVDCCIG